METDPKKVREYGLSLRDQRHYVIGAPVVEGEHPEPCPNCKCAKLYLIRVKIAGHPLLKGGNGTGTYLGCAACPFASPMVMRADKAGA